MMQDLLYLAIAVVLILVNGFFVLAEFALVRTRVTRIQELARRGSAKAQIVLEQVRLLDAYLGVCQLGITIASLGLGWVGEPAFVWLIRPLVDLAGWPPLAAKSISMAVAFVIITILHIVAGELAPKMIGIRQADRTALRLSRPLRWCYWALYLPLWILNSLSLLVLRVLRVPIATPVEMGHSEEELRMLLGASHEQGVFTLSRLLMLENILDFSAMTVADVKVPLERVAALDPAAPWEKNFELVRQRSFSRYPLRKAGGELAEQAVHLRDILLELGRLGALPDLARIGRPIHSVKRSLPLEGLLRHFHNTHTNMALVRDDHGKTTGLVTMDDVVDEIVGTVRDEFQPPKDSRLSELVPAEGILLEIEGTDYAETASTLVRAMARGRPDLAVDRAIEAIERREAMATTAIGEGVALPHGRLDGLTRPVGAIGRLPENTPLRGMDGQPIRLVFLLISPLADEGAHVVILEKVSTLLSSDYLKERLLAAKSPREVLEILRISDHSVPA